MMTIMLPLSLAISAFGLAFWMPKATVAFRVIFMLVLATVIVLGFLAATQPGISGEPWVLWAWVVISLVNVVGWIAFLVRAHAESSKAVARTDDVR